MEEAIASASLADNSNKQKKDWEVEFDRKFAYEPRNLMQVYNPANENQLKKDIKQFISSIIDETKKQAQSEMREDLIKVINKKKKEYRGKLTDNEISRFSPQADVYCEALDDILKTLNKSK